MLREDVQGFRLVVCLLCRPRSRAKTHERILNLIYVYKPIISHRNMTGNRLIVLQKIKKCNEVKTMMYPYMTLADETEIVHSQLIEKDGQKKVIVNFERPTENGFDSARCELPDYKWTEREGYSDEEIAMFEELLRNNAHLLYKYAENGGIQIA